MKYLRLLVPLMVGILIGCYSPQDNTPTLDADPATEDAGGLKIHHPTHINIPDKDKSGISYHDGPIMTNPVNVYVIWYGDYGGDSTQDIVTDFLNNLGGSPWYKINTTYYQVKDGVTTYASDSVTLAGSIQDNYSLGKGLVVLSVQNIVSNAITDGKLPLDKDGVYFVLTSPDVVQTAGLSGFCFGYCGWHDHFMLSDIDVKYAFVGDPQWCPQVCVANANELQGPNGNVGADGMVSIIAHELSEAVTDPDINAWYANDLSESENGDICVWKFGTTYTVMNGASANMKLGSRDYLIQQNWVPDVKGGYCSIKL